ncbi:MAG: oligosaccharide flippase family protein [Candidatus Hodarchaeota archaeon]
MKNKLIFDTTTTMATNFTNRFILFLRGFIVARLLDPTLYGYFSGLGLIFLYNAQAHLGILHGMNRSLSIAKGAKDSRRFEETKNNGISAITILSLIISIAIIVYSIIKAHCYPRYIIWGMRIYAVVALMHHFEYIYHSLLRVDHRFKEINISRLIFTASNLILVVVLIYFFGFYGVLISLLTAIIFQNAYLFIKGNLTFKFTINTGILKDLLRIGAPISFAYLINVILNSIDRIMIIRFLDASQLGFYGIALAFSTELLLRIPNTISYVIYPRILQKYGESGNTNSLINLFQAPSIFIACVMVTAIGLLFLTIEYIITYLLPNYIPAILVTKILIFAVYFISINQIAVRIMITTKCTKALISFQLVAIMLNIIVNYLVIRKGMGITGVALATAFSYSFYSFGVTYYTLNKLYNNFLLSMKEQCRLYVPIIYCSMVLFVLSKIPHLNPVISEYFFHDIMVVALNMLTFSIMMSPFILYLSRMSNIKIFLKTQAEQGS